jgi:hypothetical protein
VLRSTPNHAATAFGASSSSSSVLRFGIEHTPSWNNKKPGGTPS